MKRGFGCRPMGLGVESGFKELQEVGSQMGYLEAAPSGISGTHRGDGGLHTGGEGVLWSDGC